MAVLVVVTDVQLTQAMAALVLLPQVVAGAGDRPIRSHPAQAAQAAMASAV
jgi:hypothetical protein